jgi:hypothetical protein
MPMPTSLRLPKVAFLRAYLIFAIEGVEGAYKTCLMNWKQISTNIVPLAKCDAGTAGKPFVVFSESKALPFFDCALFFFVNLPLPYILVIYTKKTLVLRQFCNGGNFFLRRRMLLEKINLKLSQCHQQQLHLLHHQQQLHLLHHQQLHHRQQRHQQLLHLLHFIGSRFIAANFSIFFFCRY